VYHDRIFSNPLRFTRQPQQPEVAITCKVCDRGTLARKNPYRLARGPVFIGYLLLIPSAIGLCIAICFAFLILTVSSDPSHNPEARAIVGTVGIGVVAAGAIATVIGSLLGELLIMKKRVLQCSTCGATISAS
jgi:hypothetical protein